MIRDSQNGIIRGVLSQIFTVKCFNKSLLLFKYGKKRNYFNIQGLYMGKYHNMIYDIQNRSP